MKIVHIKVTFEDTFSFARLEKVCTRSEITFEKMKSNLGAIVKQFENGINYEWKLIKIERHGNK
jgi:hypothetical protein